VQIDYYYGNASSGFFPPEYDATLVVVGLHAPVLFHPAPHFFVGLGPHLFHDLSRALRGADAVSNSKRTFFGISTTVGGWF
jgi:hypothetical protein